MSLRKYREEELFDSLVIDKEGYICGHVSGFNVESNQIVMKLYTYEVKKVESPDEEELINRLSEFIPQKGGVFRQTSETGDLYNWVRERLQLSSREPVTLEHLVECAKVKKLEVPYTSQEKRVKTEKESISWSLVDKIAFTDLGKCILLKKAVEAANRGVAISKQVDFKSTEQLSGKTVVDSEAKIVGSALKFLIGNPPGILVNTESIMKREYPDIEAFKKTVGIPRFKDLKHFYDQVKKDLKLTVVSDDDLLIWAKKNNINVPNIVVERKEVLMELYVDWNNIAKIGDVVVLSEPIEALMENIGSYQKPMSLNKVADSLQIESAT